MTHTNDAQTVHTRQI